jgi:chaperonin GroEL
VEIVMRAVTAPLRQIVENTGLEGSVVCAKIVENDDIAFGYNALTHQYGDMFAMGVIVPTKVEVVALSNAASVAGLLLTTEAVVCEKKEKPAA